MSTKAFAMVSAATIVVLLIAQFGGARLVFRSWDGADMGSGSTTDRPASGPPFMCNSKEDTTLNAVIIDSISSTRLEEYGGTSQW
jgi:hypothetical protein